MTKTATPPTKDKPKDDPKVTPPPAPADDAGKAPPADPKDKTSAPSAAGNGKAAAAPKFELVPVGKLRPAADNVRTVAEAGDGMVATIKAVGVVEPLVVTPAGDGHYEVIAGNRRLDGAKKAGLREVPVLIRSDLSEADRAEIMVVENLEREDLPALDEARAYERLVALGWSQRRVAERIGRSQAHISKRLSLLKLPEQAHKALDKGLITLSDTLQLSELAEHPQHALVALKRVIEKGKDDGTYRRSWTMEQAVDAELQEISWAQARERTRAELEEKGVPIASFGKYEYDIALRKDGLALVGGYMPGDPSEKGHGKLACHAAAVLRDGDVVYVCTNPKSHVEKDEHVEKGAMAAGGKSGADDEAKKAKEEAAAYEKRLKAHREALKKAHGARVELVKKVVAKAPPKDQAISYLAQVLIEDVADCSYGQDHLSALHLACRALGLEEAPQEDSVAAGDAPIHVEVDDDTRVGALSELAASGPAAALRVAVALAAARVEQDLAVMESWTLIRLADSYMAFLEGRGYTPSPAEKKALRGQRP